MKRILSLTFLLALLLAACQGGNTPTATEVAVPSPELVQPSPTPIPDEGTIAETTATQTVVINQAPAFELILGESMPGCTVVSFNPTPEPTLQAIFPPPSEGDWIKGSETASVTITEYSDFQ